MKPFIKGELKITSYSKFTGEIVDVYGFDSNIVTDSGIDTMWLRAANDDAANQYQLKDLHLGDDFGNTPRWSIFNPEPPSRGFNDSTQSVTHVVDSYSYDFPIDEVLRFYTTVDGETMMNTYFPDQISYDFTSATIRYNNGTIFAYKRFPIRSISRAVTVEFDWRFKIINSDEWCVSQDIGSLGD